MLGLTFRLATSVCLRIDPNVILPSWLGNGIHFVSLFVISDFFEPAVERSFRTGTTYVELMVHVRRGFSMKFYLSAGICLRPACRLQDWYQIEYFDISPNEK